MNLFEISDEFATPKTLPAEDIEFLKKKEKAISYELMVTRNQQDKLMSKIVGGRVYSTMDGSLPDNPEHQANIQKQIDQGYIPVIQMISNIRHIKMFVPDVKDNKQIVAKLERVLNRISKLEKMLRDVPREVKRAKARLSAWTRKQPNYVGRTTGKQLLNDVQDQITKFIEDNNLRVTITNAYYWAKNKMIVIEITVSESSVPGAMHGMTSWDKAKKIIKPKLTQLMTDLGYNQFRVLERYLTSSVSTVKIQLDDVEAKNKASENETE